MEFMAVKFILAHNINFMNWPIAEFLLFVNLLKNSKNEKILTWLIDNINVIC